MCAWLLEETAKRSESLTKSGKSAFEARNNIQVFYAKTLSIVFAQVSLTENYPSLSSETSKNDSITIEKTIKSYSKTDFKNSRAVTVFSEFELLCRAVQTFSMF